MCFELLFPMVFIIVGAGLIFLVWSPPRPAHEAAPIKHSSIKQAIFCGIFCMGGLALLGFSLPMVMRYRASQSWPATPCNIVRSSVVGHTTSSRHGGSSTSYSIEVLFRYKYDGRRYDSTRYRLVQTSGNDYAARRQIINNLNKHRKQTCYVNPLDPADAVLDRSFSWLIVVLGLVGICMLSGGGYGLRAVVSSANREHQEQLDEQLAPSQRGQAELHPQFSPTSELIGNCMPALIWNGIVIGGVFAVAQGWRNGHGEIMPTVFVAVFGLIGIAILVQALSKVRDLFLPKPQLTLTRSPLGIGEPAELRWQISDMPNPLQGLSIQVAMFHEVRSGQHAAWLKNQTPAWQMDLLGTTKRIEMQSGRKSFVIPPEAITEVGNEKPIWAILLQGDFGNGRQLRQAYPIHVIGNAKTPSLSSQTDS